MATTCQAPKGEGGNDQAGEYQIDADELHRCSNGEGKSDVEAQMSQALAQAEPVQQDAPRQEGHRRQLRVTDPENLSDQQVFEMFATMGIVCQQQDATTGRDDEQNADGRFLHVRPMSLGPGEEERTEQSRGDGRCLYGQALRFKAEQIGGDDAQASDLGDGKIDEDDAARQHLVAQRHVGAEHQQAGDKGRPEDG